MLGKVSVALLLIVTPAVASGSAAETGSSPAPEQEYRVKKVCRTVEVAGSMIPRTSCVNKKIPVKKAEPPSQGTAGNEAAPADASGAQKQQ